MDNWSYKSIVYAIRHNLSNRVYVGCTFCNGRIERHLRLLANGKHPVPLMQKDCDDLGFTYSAFVLEECDEDCRMDRERYWILKLKSFNPDYGYNYRDNRFIPPRDIDLDKALMGRWRRDHREDHTAWQELQGLRLYSRIFQNFAAVDI